MLQYILDRAREPSTWAGLGPLVTAAGWQVSPEHWEAISMAGMGICGIIAIVLKDKK